MTTHLKEVKNFCETGFKNGRLIPLSFNFPAFEITEDVYKEVAMEIVAEKVRLGLDCGTYKTEAMEIVDKQVTSGLKSKEYGKKVYAMLKDIFYDDLIQAQIATKEGDASNLQKNQLIFSDNMLAKQMNADSNLNYVEIGKKTILEACNSRLKDRLNDISMLRSIGSLGDIRDSRDSLSAEIMNKKYDLAATMILVKEHLPSAYKQFNLSLNNFGDKNLIKELKNLENEPDIILISKIAKFDDKFAEKNYPKIHHQLKNNEPILKFG